MKAFVYYGGERIEFEVPSGWKVLYGKEIEPAKPCTDAVEAVRRSLKKERICSTSSSM